MNPFRDTLAVCDLAFRRLEAQIPCPSRVPKGDNFVFRYVDHTPEIVVVQKLSRTLTGLRATLALLEKGLYQEVGAMFRMLDEFREDVSLMCDAIRNGHTSKMQQRFIDEFFQEEFDADSPLDSTQRRNRVPRRKIQAFIAQLDANQLNPSDSQEVARTIANTNSGYVHGTSDHILEMCGGNPPRYYLDGMLGTRHEETFEKTARDYLYRALISFIEAALAFGQYDLDRCLDQFKHSFEQCLGMTESRSAEEWMREIRRNAK